MKRVSIFLAVALGTLWVNLPVIPLMLAPMAMYVFSVPGRANERPGPSGLPIALGLILVGFVLAWSWWSFMVPRWRLWAWRRVDDIAGLRRSAVRAGLIWPDDHLFERTEFRTKGTQSELEELESSKDAKD